MKTEPLGVWFDGVRVAELTTRGPGDIRSRYTQEALDRWPGNVPLLSCSLPLVSGWVRAGSFFSGLLPEGAHRRAMADMAKRPSYDTFGLLERFGRDVAGALVLGREAPEDRPGGVKPYSAAELAQEVAELDQHPLGLHEDSELSIAGLQDKMTLVRLPDGGWGRPVRGAPSTHILKVEDRRSAGMARAEATCLQLARAVGLTTVEAEVHRIGELPCLIVSRFDRAAGSHGVERVHQEDACQALARDPDAARGRGKYESAGGPSLQDVARLLDRYSVAPDVELLKLVAAVIFTLAIGNADAHGKNLALLHPSPEHAALAPLYDTVPTALWPALRAEMAMSVNGRWDIDAITLADVVDEAAAWKVSREAAAMSARHTAEAVLGACDAVRDADERVLDLVRARTTRLLTEG